jgi:hypothetical protein
MSGLSFFDALGVRGVDRKPLIIAELAEEPLRHRCKFSKNRAGMQANRCRSRHVQRLFPTGLTDPH